MTFNQEEADKALELAESIVNWKLENPNECTINMHNVSDLKFLSQAVISLSKELKQYKTPLEGSVAYEMRKEEGKMK